MRRTLFEPEHVDFRESVQRFVAEEVVPHQEDWEREGIVSRDVFARAAEKGMLAMQVPEPYGGVGIDDFRFNQIVNEELSVAGAGGSGLGITLHNDICLPYFTDLGNEEQRERWPPATATSSTAPRRSSPTGSMPTSSSPPSRPTPPSAMPGSRW